MPCTSALPLPLAMELHRLACPALAVKLAWVKAWPGAIVGMAANDEFSPGRFAPVLLLTVPGVHERVRASAPPKRR